MKKTQEIIGLPIISISDGMEVGKVKAVVVNAGEGAVDYIVVESAARVLGTWVIPAGSILGIGEYALTIENEENIIDVGKVPQAVELIQKDIQVKNTRVMTRKGRLIGETGDFYVDEEESCQIAGLELIAFPAKDKVRIIPRKSVITFGKTLIVVSDNVESTLMDSLPQHGSETCATEEKENLAHTPTETAGTINPVLPTKMEGSEGPSLGQRFPEYAEEGEIEETPDEAIAIGKKEEATAVPQDTAAAPAQSSASSLFEQKQRQYLVGRKVTKTITDSMGNVIIGEGEVISNEAIDAAKNSGKLIELVMNNKG
ncbi:MAG: PRC-barrel domain-containing protein [Clostridiales bacterium]|jgi:uncharacterized protein YrrD|nr:PRC-barrel domain-containing protein [Eubacteriales bacterium]MDH7566411.1 PRC-barrel domain-containing protein [Clostridiales bacterium]